jgi:hypothetical protein
MFRLLMILAMAGCGQINVSADMFPCESVELDAETDLFVKADGQDVLVYRAPVFSGNNDTFSPTITFERGILFVREGWEPSEESDGELCVSPAVRYVDPPQKELIVEWYMGDEIAPDFRLRFNPSEL